MPYQTSLKRRKVNEPLCTLEYSYTGYSTSYESPSSLVEILFQDDSNFFVENYSMSDRSYTLHLMLRKKLNSKRMRHTLTSGDHDGNICMWDIASRTCVKKITNSDIKFGGVLSITEIDQHRFASSGGNGNIKIWNTQTYELNQMLEGHSDWVRAVVAHNKNTLYSGSEDKTIKMWDLGNGTCTRTFVGHSFSINCIALLSRNHIVSGSSDYTLRVWNTFTGECVKVLKGHESAVKGVVSMSESVVVSASSDKTIRVWSVDTGLCLKVIEGHTHAIKGITKLDSVRVATCDDISIRVWNIITGNCIRHFSMSETESVCTIFAIDSIRLAVSSFGKGISILDVGREDTHRTSFIEEKNFACSFALAAL